MSTMTLFNKIPQHLIDLIYEYESSPREKFSNAIIPEISVKCIACQRILNFEFCVSPFVEYVCSIACDHRMYVFWEQTNNPQYNGGDDFLLEGVNEDEDEEDLYPIEYDEDYYEEDYNDY
jgi:hypothetical protein